MRISDWSSDVCSSDLHPPYVIAEACINHEGDIAIAREMVLHARTARCDAIKFQMHVLDDEMLHDAPQSANFAEPPYDALERTRSEERRVGNECVRTCSLRWWP